MAAAVCSEAMKVLRTLAASATNAIDTCQTAGLLFAAPLGPGWANQESASQDSGQNLSPRTKDHGMRTAALSVLTALGIASTGCCCGHSLFGSSYATAPPYVPPPTYYSAPATVQAPVIQAPPVVTSPTVVSAPVVSQPCCPCQCQ